MNGAGVSQTLGGSSDDASASVRGLAIRITAAPRSGTEVTPRSGPS